MVTKSRPSVYTPPLPFIVVRIIAFVSAAIVAGILTYFTIVLANDGYRMPWIFMVVLLSTALSLITLLITTIVHSCFFLSPILNIIANSIVLTIYLIGFALLTWNLYGMLGHSCSAGNWVTSAGISVCNTYKALYSFDLFGVLAQIAAIVLDVRARRLQTRQGTYDRMAAERDFKMGDIDGSSTSGSFTHSRGNSDLDALYNMGYRSDQSTARFAESNAAPDNATTGADYPSAYSRSNVRMDDFNNAYGSSAAQTSYSNSGYGGGGGGGYSASNQGRYDPGYGYGREI